MSIAATLLTGPAGAGKSAVLAATYREAMREQPLLGGVSCCFLAPNHFAVVDLQSAFMADHDAALVAPGVETFAGFARRVLLAAGKRFFPLSAAQRRRLLRRTIDAALGEGALTFFRHAARRPGFVAQVEASIADWKRQDLWAEELQRRQNKRTPQRDRELVDLYGRYQLLLNRGNFYDDEGLFWAARDALRTRNRLLHTLRLAVLDGFSDFTAAQYDILSLLAQRAEQFLIALPGEPLGAPSSHGRKDLFAKCDATRRRLEEVLGVTLTETSVDEIRASKENVEPWPAMRHLERNLFRSLRASSAMTPSARSGVGRIQIVEACSEQAEVEEVARRIKQLLLSGTDPHEVTVAFRSTGEYADRVRSVFADFGIPLALDAAPRLSSTPLVRSLLGVLRLALNDWPYRELLVVAGNRMWAWFDQGFGLASTGERENRHRDSSSRLDARGATEYHVRLAQVPDGRDALLRAVRATSDRLAEGANRHAGRDATALHDAATSAAALEKLTTLSTLLSDLVTPASMDDWLERFESLVTSLGAPGWRSELADDPWTVTASRENLADWDALRKGLLGIVQVDVWLDSSARSTRLDLRQIVELIHETSGQLRAPRTGGMEGCVRVLSAEAARCTRPKHLFVAGLVEQSFPSAARNSELASDASMTGLWGADRTGVDVEAERRAERQREEMLLFYQLVTCATETLTLSYPALDAKAQSRPPSPYLTEVERCFAGASLPRTRLTLGGGTGSDRSNDDAAISYSLSSWRRSAAASALFGRCEALARATATSPGQGGVPGLVDGLEAIASRSQWEGFDVHEGMLTSRTIQRALAKRFGADHLWSPSQLETYATCPFKFLGEQLLGLAPPPDLRLASDYRRRGSLLHEALAQFHQQASPDPHDDPFGDDVAPDGEASLAIFIERFRQRVDAVYGEGAIDGVDGALREIERLQIFSWADALAEQHTAYAQLWPQLDVPPTPTHLEVRFGPSHRSAAHEQEGSKSTDEPYLFDLGEEAIRLTGRIDRIDVGRVGDTKVFNVIDYKTSKSASVDVDQIRTGRQLQLALYTLAAAELLLKDEQARPLAAGYWAVQGEGFNTQGSQNKKGPKLEMSTIVDGKVALKSEWETLHRQIAERVASIVADIRGGRFPVYNDDEDCGRSCDLKTLCRIGHVRSLGKVWSPL